MKNKMYDRAKWVAQVGLPTLGSLYFALSGIWHFPDVEQVVGTITIVDLALGGLLHVSTKGYNDGQLNVITDPSDGGTAVQVDANDHPAEYAQGQKVLLKVNKLAVPPSSNL